jgi:hypothetical protein
MAFTTVAVLMALALFAGLLVLQEVGWRWGLRRAALGAGGGREGLSSLEGAVYGLLGLLIAFSFSGAASRFEARRDLIVEEANAIGTAYLRLDLLPDEARDSLREKFRRYLDTRLAAYRKLPDLEAAMAELGRASALQGEIWKEAIPASKAAGPPASVLLPPALNEMFDITTTRTAATRAHPPTFLFVMLVILALVSALLVGNGMSAGKSSHRLHMLAYAGILALTIYVIVDLEFPRVGLIRVDAADRVLVEVREGMK